MFQLNYSLYNPVEKDLRTSSSGQDFSNSRSVKQKDIKDMNFIQTLFNDSKSSQLETVRKVSQSTQVANLFLSEMDSAEFISKSAYADFVSEMDKYNGLTNTQDNLNKVIEGSNAITKQLANNINISENKLSNINSNLKIKQTSLNSKKDEKSSLVNSKNTTEANIKNIENGMESNSKALSAIDESISTTYASLSGVNSDILSISTQIASLNNQIANPKMTKAVTQQKVGQDGLALLDAAGNPVMETIIADCSQEEVNTLVTQLEQQIVKLEEDLLKKENEKDRLNVQIEKQEKEKQTIQAQLPVQAQQKKEMEKNLEATARQLDSLNLVFDEQINAIQSEIDQIVGQLNEENDIYNEFMFDYTKEMATLSQNMKSKKSVETELILSDEKMKTKSTVSESKFEIFEKARQKYENAFEVQKQDETKALIQKQNFEEVSVKFEKENIPERKTELVA
jgi:chromosome segregation ATPase